MIFFFSLNNLEAQNSNHDLWVKDYRTALESAQKQKKPLLIFFTGSDWCGNCKRLEKHFFETVEFLKMANEHLVLYVADFPKNKSLISEQERQVNIQLINKYNDRKAFPTVSIIDIKGELKGSLTGFNKNNSPELHFELIRNSLKN